MLKDSKIYIAGHTGLLGSALVKKLESDDYENIILRRHSELDLTDQNDTNNFFKEERPEYVFLAAGLTGGIVANDRYPATFLHTNIAIQDNVFQAANNYSVKHIVFYGSSCIYPKNCPKPMKEEYLQTGKIEETSDAYAIAKTTGIIACKSYNRQFGTNRFIALVPNSMYGPNDNFDIENSHVLSALIRKFHTANIEQKEKIILWGTGNPRREFIFSEDVADASIFIMNNIDRNNIDRKTTKFQNMHYNVGTGVDYSIKELANIISQIVGYKGKIEWNETRPDGSPMKLLDSSKFLDLGWRPSINIEDGIRMTYDWYVKNYAD